MSDIAALIGQASAGKAPTVVLIEGDEYLARTSARELADAIVPSRERALNLIVLDAAAGAREIASHLVTVGMFAAPKAVVVEGADAFAEEVDAERELTRVREPGAGRSGGGAPSIRWTSHLWSRTSSGRSRRGLRGTRSSS